jgi:serine protease Do
MLPHAKGKLAWAAAGVFVLGAGFSAPTLLRTAAADTAGLPLPTPNPTPSSISPGTAPDYARIFANNQAAVVSIISATEEPADQEDQLCGPNGQFGGNQNNQEPQGNVPVRALGSGFIVTHDGLILTNAHVVSDAKTVTVTLSDHRQYKGTVLGADKSSDIAVVKINANNLPTVRLGNSASLAVGDYVMAIGAPFGLTESATSGIVSALSRSLPGDSYVNFIQTDAPVNPGNSGGPLFNATGSVVGINSQIYTNSCGYQGIAFAIPINLADRIADEIVETGHAEHGQLGVQVQNVNQSLANSFGLTNPEGALVAKVEPDSPAKHAGLQVGDVITKYDGHAISDAGQLALNVNTTPSGQRATLTVWRDGKPLTIVATIGSTTSNMTAEARTAPTSEQMQHLGLTVRPLTSSEREQAGVGQGLVVEAAHGNAAEAGIQQGDVLLAVGGTPVQSVSQLRQLLEKDKHDNQVALLIQRRDNQIFVPVNVG